MQLAATSNGPGHSKKPEKKPSVKWPVYCYARRLSLAKTTPFTFPYPFSSMKNLLTAFSKLAVVAVCALSLGSCSRANYAMLPKGGSYHGITRPATVAHAPSVAVATPATASAAPTVATAPSVASPAASTTPAVAKPAQSTAAALESPKASGTTVAATPAPKLGLVQRIALSQVIRKVDKLVKKSGGVRQHDNTAATQRLEGRLRQGIILAVIGLIVEIIGAVVNSGLIYLLGAILIIVGGVFIVLYLIDKL